MKQLAIHVYNRYFCSGLHCCSSTHFLLRIYSFSKVTTVYSSSRASIESWVKFVEANSLLPTKTWKD